MTSALKTLFLAAGLTLSGAAASLAATVTFDLTSGNGTASGDGFSFESGGVTLTASAHNLESDGDAGDLITLSQFARGLGIAKTHDGDAFQVDSGEQEEMIALSFSEGVSISEITFTRVRGTSFSFTVFSGDTVNSFDRALPFAYTSASAFSFANGSDVSNSFGIGAANTGTWNAFLLESITVETTTNQLLIAPVPLPAGGLLLLTGMGGLAALRRRR